MKKIRVCICDDAEYVCDIISEHLKSAEDIDVIGFAHDSEEVLELVSEKPDILLLDIQMENDTAGIDCIPDILEKSPGTKIIMLTSFDNEDYIYSAMINGAVDYVVKDDVVERIVPKIRNIHNNINDFDNETVRKFVNKAREFASNHVSCLYLVNILIKLSNNEYEILKAIYNGETYSDIAKSRFIEEITVRSTVSRILKKFNMKTMKDVIVALKETQVFELMDKF